MSRPRRPIVSERAAVNRPAKMHADVQETLRSHDTSHHQSENRTWLSQQNAKRLFTIPSMRRVFAILGSVIFLLFAPGIVAGYVPWRICQWREGAPLLGYSAFRFIGLLLIAVALPILFDSLRASHSKDSAHQLRSFRRALGCRWVISICAKPNVYRRRLANPWSGVFLREHRRY